MTKAKRRLILEVAYDLIAKVHSDICNSTTRDDDTADYTLEILRQIIMLDKKLKGGAE
jgi:hypothetical protein